MASLINRFLVTGRLIRDLEGRLFAGDVDQDQRADLGAELSRLIRRQQDEIVAAVDAGAPWDTVRFVLAFHGQDADRDQYRGLPTPAELLGDLFATYGPAAVLEALDTYRRSAHGHRMTERVTPGRAVPSGRLRESDRVRGHRLVSDVRGG